MRRAAIAPSIVAFRRSNRRLRLLVDGRQGRGARTRALPTSDLERLNWTHGEGRPNGRPTQLPFVFPAIREGNEGADRGPKKRSGSKGR
jgi:hypothetical protein